MNIIILTNVETEWVLNSFIIVFLCFQSCVSVCKSVYRGPRRGALVPAHSLHRACSFSPVPTIQTPHTLALALLPQYTGNPHLLPLALVPDPSPHRDHPSQFVQLRLYHTWDPRPQHRLKLLTRTLTILKWT